MLKEDEGSLTHQFVFGWSTVMDCIVEAPLQSNICGRQVEAANAAVVSSLDIYGWGMLGMGIQESSDHMDKKENL